MRKNFGFYPTSFYLGNLLTVERTTTHRDIYYYDISQSKKKGLLWGRVSGMGPWPQEEKNPPALGGRGEEEWPPSLDFPSFFSSEEEFEE